MNGAIAVTGADVHAQTTFGTREPVTGLRGCIIVAAHPDDEVIGLGGQLAALKPYIIHITDGAPKNMCDALAHGFATRQEYARARREELLGALELAGIGQERCCSLGVADQEASYHMAAIAKRLAGMLEGAVVYTHPYEGGHPDHDATAFAVHASGVREVREFTSYHDRGGALVPYQFRQGGGETVAIDLELKHRMLDAFATQRETLRPFYNCAVERRRRAPQYDFTAPPGEAYYDRFPWGIRSPEWRERALAAMRELL
jgi:LmbE family N-acetylglucosaminyl deacetylase